MTPEERAAQIWCTPYMAAKEMDVELCYLIAAQIREAVEEAQAQSNQMLSLLSYDLGVKDGEALAYEDAAKIARKHFLHDNCAEDCVDNIEEEIRARAKEVRQ